MRGTGDDDSRPDCRNDEALIGEYLSALWMIDDHQLQIIVVIGLPQLAGDTEIVVTVAGGELVVADLVPLFGSRDAGCSQVIDTQTNRRSPRDSVFHEVHARPVVCEEERA